MKQRRALVINIGYWVLYVLLILLFFFFLKIANPDKAQFQTKATVWLGLMLGLAIAPGLIGFYATYCFFFPRVLARRRTARVVWQMIALVFLAAVAGTSILCYALRDTYMHISNKLNFTFVVVVFTFICLLNASMAALLRGFMNWYKGIHEKIELIQKNHELELNAIKFQLEPHFLFNTINNIDFLITREPARASSYLNKLSEMLRFMLYETKGHPLPLTAELDYLKKYIDLQKIRLTNPDAVRFEQSGDPGAWRLEPLLFLPFVENAFKHFRRGAGAFIAIGLSIEEHRLEFDCVNAAHPEPEEKPAGGIGKELIEKRLQYLYPNRHRLTYVREPHAYAVKLVIWQ